MRHQLVYVGVAYGAIWAGITAYVLYLGRRQRAIERRLDDLRSRDPSL